MPHHTVPGIDASVKQDAVQHIKEEKAIGAIQSFRLYRKAVFWSFALSSCIMMEGFDLVILNSLYVLPSFQQRFGTPDKHGDLVISSHWQQVLSNSPLMGQIVGLILSGYVVEKIGYKYTLIAGLVTLAITITATFVAETSSILALGLFLCGIPWGVFQTTTTTYASEVTPLQLRPFLTTYVNFCWCFGQMVCSFVLRRVSTLSSKEAYKIPLATQWIWILPLIIAISFAPESPWWLIRRGRTEDAKRALLRLTTRHHTDHVNTKAAVNMMFYTNELEKSQSGGMNYWDCFKGTDLRRTEISCNVWAVQVLSGGALMNYSAYFYSRAGMSSTTAFSFQCAQYGLGMLGTITSWFLMTKFGRRTLYLFGQSVGLLVFAAMGILACFLSGDKASWTMGSLLLAFTLSYDLTVGPVCYTLVAEISSTRLRNKTIVLARIWYNALSVAMTAINPQMLNPTAWNLGGKSGFVYVGTTLIMLTWTYFRLPETKGRSFTELDMLFEDGIAAKDFDAASPRTLVMPENPDQVEEGKIRTTNVVTVVVEHQDEKEIVERIET
ncbi:sugar transporter [Myriangium duriaei CBS 260.36]|uniref:Sugar transporter n=1 Tax=Myriangium duriaei CBS 260.36 TaxID=1168546 RepID=A0A9P4IVI0_9PEZI|nr:sugar transporter [Myriangium duriaei CBS 260.36]